MVTTRSRAREGNSRQGKPLPTSSPKMIDLSVTDPTPPPKGKSAIAKPRPRKVTAVASSSTRALPRSLSKSRKAGAFKSTEPMKPVTGKRSRPSDDSEEREASQPATKKVKSVQTPEVSSNAVEKAKASETVPKTTPENVSSKENSTKPPPTTGQAIKKVNASLDPDDAIGVVQKRRRRLSVNTDAAFGHLLRRNFEVTEQEHKALNILDKVAKDTKATPNAKARDRRSRGSICGTGPHHKQPAYENKLIQMHGAEDLKRLGIGFACKKGLKPEAPNQDDFSIIWYDPYRMYAVFDGHGPYGHEVSNHCQNMLPQEIVKVMEEFPSGHPQHDAAIKEAFYNTQMSVARTSRAQQAFDATLSGTTATAVWHDNDNLHCAHVGDSRAVLGMLPDPESTKYVAQDLSEDHKPELPEETCRINSAGGEVKKMPGDIPHRVFARGQYYPGLAMSRALGDLVAHRVGVSWEPPVATHPMSPETQFLIVCTDGVWEFISSQEAVDMVARHGPDGAHEAAEELAKKSWDKWIEVEGNVVDDISVIVSWVSRSRELQMAAASESDGTDEFVDAESPPGRCNEKIESEAMSSDPTGTAADLDLEAACSEIESVSLADQPQDDSSE